jgi:hypothetical protein
MLSLMAENPSNLHHLSLFLSSHIHHRITPPVPSHNHHLPCQNDTPIESVLASLSIVYSTIAFNQRTRRRSLHQSPYTAATTTLDQSLLQANRQLPLHQTKQPNAAQKPPLPLSMPLASLLLQLQLWLSNSLNMDNQILRFLLEVY